MKKIKMLLAAAMCVAAGSLGAAPAVTVRVTPETGVIIAGPDREAMIRIAIDAEKIAGVPRAGVNLAIALDRSGSMGGEKIENAKRAAITALKMLNDDDWFSLVVYDGSAQVLIPATRVGDRIARYSPDSSMRAIDSARNVIIDAINQIRPGGSTALFSGVSLAVGELEKAECPEGFVRRVVLLSDGQANVGPSTPADLGRLGAGLVKEGISVSTVGVGLDYNEDLMTSLAQNSDGNFYYVEKSSDLPFIFERELSGALSVAARSVRLRIECPRGVRPVGILGHEARIDGNTVEIDFNQIYSGHRKVLVLQVEAADAREGSKLELAEVNLQYTDNAQAVQNLSVGKVTVAVSRDTAEVKKSLNRDASADIAIQRSVVQRSEALKKIDAGDVEGGRQIMADSNAMLRSNLEYTGSAEVAEAAKLGESQADKLKDAAVGSEEYVRVRKAVKGNAYQVSNSQTYQQE
ncbi:MAG: VWA domain-containing protein [Victivallaceae bacterium]